MVGWRALVLALSRHGQHQASDAVQQQDRHREERQVVSTASQLARKVKDMNDREEYFCRAAARQSLFCAVWIVALVALVAWLV